LVGLVRHAAVRCDAAQMADVAVAAHRRSQGGRGSGADVLAALYGGILQVREGTSARPIKLPPSVHIDVVAMGEPASTTQLIGCVQALRERDPTTFSEVMTAMQATAEQGVAATERNDAMGFVDVCQRYGLLMQRLGEVCEAPIVTPAMQA